VHRDIKPENFLLQNKTRDSPLKVIDFGLAKRFESGVDMTTKAGTPYYVAPQVLAGKYSEKCDIWSCGVIAYVLLCGYPPFYGDTDEEILRMVKKGQFDFPSPDWDGISPPGKDMIRNMLTLDESKRPTAAQCLDNKWLRDHADKPTGKLRVDLGTKLRGFTGHNKMKKVALTLIAQQLEEKDIEELKNTFKLLDSNSDGTLTMAEIISGMEKHKISMGADFEATLRAMDTDGSGTVEYTEFIAATMTTQQYLRKEVLWAAFRCFDKDGDGFISKKEIKEMVKDDTHDDIVKLDEMVNMMLKESDADGDGQISWEEFEALMKTK
jgi:calcium-dependent protein kinase